MNRAPTIEPKLAPPGAGLPWPARLINRFIVKPFLMRPCSWEESERRFQRRHARVSAILHEFSVEDATKRVLVPPQTGLEDSSRYWSAAMTARHLTIVGQGMERMVVELSHGRKIPLKVDIALVKPELECNDVSEIETYIQFGDTLIERIHERVGDRNSALTHHHPWFGELRARDWVWLLGIHAGIHLVQLQKIKEGLERVR